MPATSGAKTALRAFCAGMTNESVARASLSTVVAGHDDREIGASLSPPSWPGFDPAIHVFAAQPNCTDSVFKQPRGCSFAFSRRGQAPEVCGGPCSSERRRAQGMPGARCTRGLVCHCAKKKRTRAYRFSGGSPASPARMVLRLMPRSPRRRILLVTVITRTKGLIDPVGSTSPPRT